MKLYGMASIGRRDARLALCIGNLDLLQKNYLGLCGSHEATEKGIAVALETPQSCLLVRGSISFSGFAAGVEMNAHLAALAAGGTTTVVLAEGFFACVKREIREEWDERRMLVLASLGRTSPGAPITRCNGIEPSAGCRGR